MQINTVPAMKQNDLLADINNVQKRIKEIEDQFSIKNFSPEKMTFDQTLTKQMKDVKPDRGSGIGQQTADTVQSAGRNDSQTPSAAAVHNVPPQQIEEMIQKAAVKYGVDAKLLSAVAETESNYNAEAVSSAGAVGVMQLMPNTASELGVTNPYDAQQNIEGGAKYLKELLNDFGGNVREAVAAYNAGPQAVKKYQGVPPYAETQNYVSHVLDLYQ
ncbi:lytic transglycosylase domain-containing protein [Pectinatus haikarae]|uniref:Soluble lytic murein transglycosylase-like protein n=1 Tax=Pectinatus haikarae TaxID=349096 RepID=A0ABT9Y7H4_9FIRM|nr:lytic transglycosylase domain-containing protein [Pectinatus haikarae]MDQ0203779.1 soluble lytic murein transglycosylase-like protein [Pectinatus haikarae]